MSFETTAADTLEENPLLSKDIRFLFQPNSAELDMTNQDNQRNLESIKQMLKISPGSTILLRGHVDNARVPEFRQQGGEGEVVEAGLGVELDAPEQRRPFDGAGGQPVHELGVEEPRGDGQGEGEGHHRQEQAPDPEGGEFLHN